MLDCCHGNSALPPVDRLTPRLDWSTSLFGVQASRRPSQLNRFDGVLRADGVEFEGDVFALSAAALRCLQRVNPDARAANGWRYWRLGTGEKLSDVYARFTEASTEPDE
jgi:hypothetical protein